MTHRANRSFIRQPKAKFNPLAWLGLVGSRTGAVLRRFGLAGAPPFPLGVPQCPNREPVSSPPLQTHRADFRQWAYLLASEQGLWGLFSWLDFQQ